MLTIATQLNEGEDFATVERREGSCTIRNFGGRPIGDGINKGFKTWFGDRLTIKCSFHACYFPENQNTLSLGPDILPRGLDVFYAINTAFLDADEQLIACGNSPHPADTSAVHGTDAIRVSDYADIPLGIETAITSYKVAYYEANAPISKSRFDGNRGMHVVNTNSDGVAAESVLEPWKSDGELRNQPFQIRSETKVLPTIGKGKWKGETADGECKLVKTDASPVDPDYVHDCTRVTVGKHLRLKTDCQVKVDLDNSITWYVHVRNACEKNLFGRLYVCFFDKHGNLVASIKASADVAANSSSPLIAIDGKPTFDPLSYNVYKSSPIPLGIETSVTSYKITLYESENPIGEVLGDPPK